MNEQRLKEEERPEEGTAEKKQSFFSLLILRKGFSKESYHADI